MIGILLTLLTALGFGFFVTGIWQAREEARLSRIRIRFDESARRVRRE